MQQNHDAGVDRRELLTGALVGAGAIALSSSKVLASAAPLAIERAQDKGGPFTLPALPYADTALEPHISAKTLGFHYGKHHKAYVDNLNALVKDNPDIATMKVEDIVRKTAGDASKALVFNNAGQVWNHTFYWNSMKAKGGGQPGGKMLEMITKSFGDFAKFKESFTTAAKTQFGSGWAWLVLDNDKLVVTKTGNAESPMAQGKKCLLTLDVWEHAYYLDYQNKRPDYIAAYLDNLINWEFAEANLA
jgi:Fe-Mn family superoxide dismutase